MTKFSELVHSAGAPDVAKRVLSIKVKTCCHSDKTQHNVPCASCISNQATLKSNNLKLICQAIFLLCAAPESFYKPWLGDRQRWSLFQRSQVHFHSKQRLQCGWGKLQPETKPYITTGHCRELWTMNHKPQSKRISIQLVLHWKTREYYWEPRQFRANLYR